MSVPERKAEPEGLIRSILAFDPSTDVVGIALVSFCEDGSVHLRFAEAFDATALEKAMTKERKRTSPGDPMTSLERRVWRIREIRTWATQAVYRASQATGWETVAMEWPNARGAAPREALQEVIGALFTVHHLAGMGIVPVTAAKAKTVWAKQEDHFRPTGSVAEDFGEKGRMVEWALQTFDLSHGHFGHHINIEMPGSLEAMADALGVAVAANSLLDERGRIKPPPAKRKKAKGKSNA